MGYSATHRYCERGKKRKCVQKSLVELDPCDILRAFGNRSAPCQCCSVEVLMKIDNTIYSTIHGITQKFKQKQSQFPQADLQKCALQLGYRSHIRLRERRVHFRDHCSATPKRRSFQ